MEMHSAQRRWIDQSPGMNRGSWEWTKVCWSNYLMEMRNRPKISNLGFAPSMVGPNQHDVVCIHAREGGEDSGIEARGMAVLLRPDTPTAAEQTAHPVSRNFQCIPYSS